MRFQNLQKLRTRTVKDKKGKRKKEREREDQKILRQTKKARELKQQTNVGKIYLLAFLYKSVVICTY